MKTLLARLLTVLTLTLLALTPAAAQTALTTTTTTAAITDTTGTNVALTSVTGVTGTSGGTITTWLLIDHEVMIVRSVTGLNATVQRGQQTRPTLHISGATVTIVPSATAFRSTVPVGGCTRTDLPYVPMIVAGAVTAGTLADGLTVDCLGTVGQWVQTSLNGPPVLGATVASPAGVLSPSGTIFIVSGTNAITGFTNPAGVMPGFTLTLIPSGVFTWTAAGNIALAGTAVVNKALTFTWSGSKWIPSYIA